MGEKKRREREREKGKSTTAKLFYQMMLKVDIYV
jgi:hypothetical protein